MSGNKRLVLVISVTVFLRLLVGYTVWRTSGEYGFFRADTPEYVNTAESLLHGSFSSSGYFSPQGTPELYRTPGYPLLVLLGVAAHHVAVVAIVENLFLAAFSAWLVWLISEELFPKSGAAFWATMLYCFEPVGLAYTNTVMSEITFTAFFLAFLLFFLRYLRRCHFAWLLWAALILGCATYVRPVTLYLSFCLALGLLLWPHTPRINRRLIAALSFLLVFLAVVSPWVLRNVVRADFAGFSTAGEWNLYFNTAVAVEARAEHRSVSSAIGEAQAATPEQYLSQHPEQRSWSEGQKARFWSTEAWKTIRKHPFEFSQVYARNCAAVVFNPGVTEILREIGAYPIDRALTLDNGYFATFMWLIRLHKIAAVLVPVMALQLMFYYALAIAGVRRAPSPFPLLLVGLFVYFVLVSGFLTAGGRLRAPIMPFICVFAGWTLSRWSSVTRRGTSAFASPPHV